MNGKSDISISGWIRAERKASPKLVIPFRELLHNSLEACRLANLQDPNITGEISLNCYIDNGMFSKFEIFDKATKFTGIKNLSSKLIYKLYHHEETNNKGFSEYGIGAKLETVRCCNNIEHHTITDTGIYERTICNIPRCMTLDNMVDGSEYQQNPDNKPIYHYDPMDNSSTGTLVICSDILPRLKNSATTDYIKNIDSINSLYSEICKHLIKYDQNCIRRIQYRVYIDNFEEPNIVRDIVPHTILEDKTKTFGLIICEDKNTRNIQSFIIKDGNYDNFDNFDNDLTSLSTICVDDSKKYISFHDIQTNDHFTGKTPKTDYKHSDICQKFEIKSKLKLILSTSLSTPENEDTNKEDKMGFNGIRESEGENMVCTTVKPLSLHWNLFKSHKTRHKQFRGVIQYDRSSDIFIGSDKSKTLSDDRDFEVSLRFNLLKLSYDYIGNIRDIFGDYNADKKSRSTPPVEPTPTPVVAPTPAPTPTPAPAPTPTLAPNVVPLSNLIIDESESEEEEEKEEEEEETQISIESPLLINPTSYTIQSQSRMRVNKENAIKTLTKIYNYSENESLKSEIKELFVNIACNIIGKGGDFDTNLLISKIPINELYNSIKYFWERDDKPYDAVKDGSNIVNFAKKYNMM